jgi:pimeloyl-ACP methyl ester carboxylesterase
VLLSASADSQPRLDIVRYRVLQALARRVGLRPLVPTLMKVLFGPAFLRDPDRAADREAWRQLIGEQSLGGALRAVDGVVERSGVRAELGQIKAPTLILVGDDDRAAPLRLGQRIQAGIQGSQLVVLATGHTSPVEQPAAVTDAIGRFLAAHAPQAPAPP